MGDETITESEVWADIDAVFSLPEREPGDIDAYQIMQRYGIAESAAHTRMAKLVRSGKWEYISVIDDTCANGRRKVIRRKNV